MIELKTAWRNSIFGRMVATFLLVILPLYGLGIGIFNWAVQMQRNDVSNTMLSQVNFYLDNLEKEVRRIKQLQYYCLNDKNLKQLALLPQSLNDYNKTIAINLLKERLDAIASSSMYIKSVNAYIPSINRVGSSSIYQTSIPEDEFDALSVNLNTMDAQFIYWDDRLFLNAIYQTTENDSKDAKKKPAFIIGIELNINELQNALHQFNNYEKGGALLINRQNLYMLVSGSNKEANKQIENYVRDNMKLQQSGSKSVKLNGERYLVVFTASEYLGIILSKFIPETDAFRTVDIFYTWFWIFTAAAVIFIFLYSTFTYRLIHKPMAKLLKSFDQIEKGDFSVSISHKYNDEFRYLYRKFNGMVSKLSMLIDQEYKQRILAKNAQLKQLQMQINPHFLYNSYYILYRMIVMEDMENSARFTKQLGTYLKFITRNSEEEITLEKEIEHAAIYSEIQEIRFSDRLKVEFGQFPEQYRSIKVPRLIVQPVIENAFEHGLAQKEEGGLLTVKFHESEEGLHIVVEDNGESMSETELEQLNRNVSEDDFPDDIEITGLLNIHRRLRFRFGAKSGLSFSRSQLGGLKAVIHLAFKEEQNVQITDC